MISKERLGDLIEQGATIYTSRFKKPDKLKLYKDFYISEENELVITAKNIDAIVGLIKLKRLFETKDEACEICRKLFLGEMEDE